eukprot:c24852_g1_i1 orf=793-1443(+)
MANSKYDYVKSFEAFDGLLPHTWIVIRIDGRSFHRFADVHDFEKPNDIRALKLMNECAKGVLQDLTDIIFAYGESDEYSFVIHKNSNLYQRRSSKLVSVIVSLFTSLFVLNWAAFFPGRELQYAPSFDGRAVCYPTDLVLRDYLSWRQVDCHINNQFNTCLWKMVQAGQSRDNAYRILKGTDACYKNEMLFKEHGINYSKLPEIFRKGTYVYRKRV